MKDHVKVFIIQELETEIEKLHNLTENEFRSGNYGEAENYRLFLNDYKKALKTIKQSI